MNFVRPLLPFFDMKDRKTVVITGGGSGIGRETARQLLETKHYKLVLVGKDKDKLEETQSLLIATLKGEPKKEDLVTHFVVDLMKDQDIAECTQKILSQNKTLYGLVNNAGVYPFGGIQETKPQIWDEAMQVNLKAAFLMTQGLLTGLKKSPDGARVVNVSSTAGLLPNHFAMAYSVSKAALIHLTKTLAKELGKDNITVNCVAPGIVRSPLHETYHHPNSDLETFYAKRGATFPLGRVGEPADVAGVIKYFLSPEAAWATGDIFVMDGGRMLL